MKATAGTAGSGRGAGAPRRAAPQRVAAKPAAKATQATVAKKVAVPVRQSAPKPGKAAARPAAKAAQVVKPAVAKSDPAKAEATRPLPSAVTEPSVAAKPGKAANAAAPAGDKRAGFKGKCAPSRLLAGLLRHSPMT